MWASVQNSITSAGDNPIKAGNDALDNVLGPSFDYLKQIQSPAAKGVSSAGRMDQVFTNTGAISGYVNDLIAGPTDGSGGFGNQMFSDTGGKCRLPGTIDPKTKLDNKDGEVVNRWTWINNKMGATDAAGVLGTSFQRAVEGNGMNGIVPGIGGDIAAMNPLKIMNAMVLDGIPPCQAFTCPVTYDDGKNKGKETRFLSPSLELNMTGCTLAGGAELKQALDVDRARTKADAAKAAAAKRGEKFAPYFAGSYGPNVLVSTDPTPTILLGVAVALFVGYAVLRRIR
jgi:hypothetical protein